MMQSRAEGSEVYLGGLVNPVSRRVPSCGFDSSLIGLAEERLQFLSFIIPEMLSVKMSLVGMWIRPVTAPQDLLLGSL